MNLRLVVIVLAGAVAALVLGLHGGSPPPAPPAVPPARVGPRQRTRAVPTGAPDVAAPSRNPFEYAGAPRPPAPRVVAPRLPSPSAAPTAVAAPVKLVGFVHRAGALRAVVSIRGDVAIVAAGDVVDGYAVLSVDEDAGVRLRDPDGAELALAVGAGG